MRMMRLTSQDGAIAIMVAVLAMVMFAATAFALDGGKLWTAKRNLITATDASALAAAGEVADNGLNACPTGVADDYLTRNAPAELDGCQLFGQNDAGYVTVEATQEVPLTFASVVGIPSWTVRSTTAVQIGALSGADGLRPLAMCDKAWTPDADGNLVIPIENAPPSGGLCGPAAGNWGWINFGEGTGVPTLQRLIDDGYQGEDPLRVGDPVPGTTSPGARCQPLKDHWESLEGPVLIVVFQDEPTTIDDRPGQPAGSQVQYTVWRFAAVEVVRVVCDGNDGELHVKEASLVAAGECCASGPAFGPLAMKICEIHPDPDLLNSHCTITVD